MKKSMKVATALAGAAVVVAGGSAFTSSNSLPTDPPVMGYGEDTTSGFNADVVTYGYDANHTHLTSVVFSNTDTTFRVADKTAMFKLTGATGEDDDCVVAIVEAGDPLVRTGTKITCTMAANNLVADITGYNLVVTSDLADDTP